MRRRVRRPSFGETLLSAAVVGGLTFVILAWAARMNGNAAVMCGGIAAVFVVRHRARVPFVRINWRRR